MKFKVTLDVDVVEADSAAMAVEVAKGHLSIEEIKEAVPGKVVDIYVDGSYRDAIAYGGFIAIVDGKEVHRQAARVMDLNALASWNIAAELKAAALGMLWAKKNGFAKAIIHHDYIGIAYWVVPDPKYGKLWKRNVEASKKYHEFVKNLGLEVEFVHVKGHSGDEWNEAVDAYVGGEVNAVWTAEVEVS